MSRPGNFALLFWSAIGILMLLGLGTWQLLRLEEKITYLASLSERVNAAPVPLSQALARNEAGDNTEFLKVTATGNYFGQNLYKQATHDGGPGWVVLTPFKSNDGITILVDRGTIPGDMRSRKEDPVQGPVTIIGVIRKHDRGRGFFDPENDVTDSTWYWWDIPAMLGTIEISPTDKVATFVLQQLPQPGAPRYPVAENLSIGIPNNHLQYAMTWYALALCLAVIAFLRARKQKA